MSNKLKQREKVFFQKENLKSKDRDVERLQIKVGDEMNAAVYKLSFWEKLLEDHIIWALFATFLPKRYVWLDKTPFCHNMVIRLRKLRFFFFRFPFSRQLMDEKDILWYGRRVDASRRRRTCFTQIILSREGKTCLIAFA